MPLSQPKREVKRAKAVVFQPRKTWTHDFCLLSNPSCNVTPSISQLTKLKDAGLGRKRITFPDKKASFMKFKSSLEKEYPKLKDQDGAFEIMRAQGGGNSRPLHLIKMPSEGYNIPYLREVIGTTTLLYIRPIKCVISTEKSDVEATSTSPTTECSGCQERMPISSLRQHKFECKSMVCNSDDSDDEINMHKEDTKSSTASKFHEEKKNSQHDEVISILDDGEGTSKQTWSSQLKHVFPDSEMEELEEVSLQSASLDEAAELMLNKLGNDEDEATSIEDLVETFAKRNSLESGEDEFVIVDRESFWIDVIRFYKKAIGKPELLKSELSVSFKNEDGLDGGAMKIEFFLLALQEVKNRLFEGNEANLIPIKDATKCLLFQLAGMIISHSLSQQASIGFPVLAPYVYAYMVGAGEDEVATLMNKNFIPLDASTSVLHDFLTSLAGCENDADVESLLEKNKMSEAFWQLINSSRWPKEQVIDIETRDFLLQHLVYHELLTSRKNEIEELKEGLKSLGLLDLIAKNAEICKVLFCADKSRQINADVLNDMMLSISPSNFAEEQSQKWFLEYLGLKADPDFPGDSRCRSLLQFWTGWSVVPFSGLTKRLKVIFLPDDDKCCLPTTSACTKTLRLPTVHSSRGKFFQSMDVALKYGKVGFPNP